MALASDSTLEENTDVNAASGGFSVHLANFDGPFDLLLQLISRHKMDVTEVSLSIVTDEFISFIRALEASGEAYGDALRQPQVPPWGSESFVQPCQARSM